MSSVSTFLTGGDKYDAATNISVNNLKGLMNSFDPVSDSALLQLLNRIQDCDTHLQFEFAKRVGAVSSLNYRFESNLGVRKSEMFEKAFKRQVNLNELIGKMMSGVLYGFACIQLDRTASITADNQISNIKLNNLRLIPHCSFFRKMDGEIRLNDPSQPDGMPLNPSEWIIHRHNCYTSNPQMSGVLRPLAKLLVYKMLALTDLDNYLHIYGIPTKVGYYPVGYENDDNIKSDFLFFLRTMASSGAGVLPESLRVEVSQAVNGGTDPFHKLIDYVDGEISKSLLGGTLTSGTSANGNRNLGELHENSRLEIAKDDARQILDTINTQLMPLMLAFNGIDPEKFEINLVVEQAETNNTNTSDNATSEESKGTLESDTTNLDTKE